MGHLGAVNIQGAGDALGLIGIGERLAAQEGAQQRRVELRPRTERCLRDALHLPLEPGAERLRGGHLGQRSALRLSALPVRGGKPDHRLGGEPIRLCGQRRPQVVARKLQGGRIGVERGLALHGGVEDAHRQREGVQRLGWRHQ
jgi:hypothetical protein